jgi:hypothetical protein
MLNGTRSRQLFGDTAEKPKNKRPRTRAAKEIVKTIYYEEHNMEFFYG